MELINNFCKKYLQAFSKRIRREDNPRRESVLSGHRATALKLASVTLPGVYFLTSLNFKRVSKQALFYPKDLSRQHSYSQKGYNKDNQGKVICYIINNLHFQAVELCSATFLESAIRIL